jgi:hypothetical protein
MKRVLAIGFICSMFVGCASSPQKDPGVAARQTCINAGFVPGTDKFSNCFLSVMQSTLNEQSKPTFLQQYMLQRAANPSRYKEVVCQPWLNGVRCEEW